MLFLYLRTLKKLDFLFLFCLALKRTKKIFLVFINVKIALFFTYFNEFDACCGV